MPRGQAKALAGAAMHGNLAEAEALRRRRAHALQHALARRAGDVERALARAGRFRHACALRGAAGAAAGGTVKAQMPGKVLQVSVKVGDTVEAGTNLLLMESMKMELAMDAPVAGKVTKVEVSPEQMVSQGDLLVEIEEQ